MTVVRRGDVVLARLDPTLGVEIKKTRPVIVLSNNSINQFAELAVVIPLTSSTVRVSPSHAVIPKGAAGLAVPSKAVTEQIRAVDKRRLVKRLGRLTPDELAHVERALKNTLALS
ncbi:MAG: type II toxin-antitoxin system PemK/MazF family toxin [Candidatus Rokubacteria bacterium]|nr:type II toxin-antitoxin system PemK/MazF family toxin [Candidatus Rokubacteria bacterium]MBI2492553.1 type II toxin-antitoxin system PemK/MazF family toxin [Candidatus Rokubacteria bacterium]